MGFLPSHFNPFVGKRKKVEALTHPNPNEWFMEWTKGRYPQLGGQSYWLSSRQLPRYSASGPLPINARHFNIAQPTTRAFIKDQHGPSVSLAAAGIITGQVYSQPLFDNDAGGFTRQAFPLVALPFGDGFPTGGGLIAAAGMA